MPADAPEDLAPLGVPDASIHPDAIGIDFTPQPRPAVACAAVGPEMVLVDGDTGMVHALNPVAAIVWQCLDGHATVADLVADLADGFGAPLDVVRDDVLEMIRVAGRAGLLAGVAERPPPTSPSEPAGLREGEPVVLPGADGSGRSMLLVGWSSTCGFCVHLLPELASLYPGLARAGTDLVLLDAGDPDATRRLLEHHGVTARVVARDGAGAGFTDPFSGMGTPVAYLLDGEARVASRLAYGADQVAGLARRAAGVPDRADPADPAGTVEAREQGSGDAHLLAPLFLPAPGGMCGPGGATVAAHQWERTAAYTIGAYRVGIRAGSASADRILGKVLADHRLPEEYSAPDNFSVVLDDGGPGGRRPLSLFLAGSATVARSRSPRRLLRAAAAHLSCLLDPEPGLVRLEAIGALVGDDAVLLPKQVAAWLDRVQAPLARLGLALGDEPFAHLDLARVELVVAPPRVRLDEDALSALADPPPGASEPIPIAPGRYPLRAWVLSGDEDHAGPVPPARAVAGALGTLVGGPRDLVAALDGFVAALDGVEVLAVPSGSPGSLTRALWEWLRPAAGGRDGAAMPW